MLFVLSVISLLQYHLLKMDTYYTVMSFCVCFCRVVRNAVAARNEGVGAPAADQVNRPVAGDDNENVIISPLS